MAKTWKLRWALQIDGVDISPVAEKTLTGDGGSDFDVEIANGQTDKAIVAAMDVSQLEGVLLVSDRAVTIETNDGSSADDTIVLAANVPYVWIVGSPESNAIGTDVVGLFGTNASGSPARVRGWWLYGDMTP